MLRLQLFTSQAGFTYQAVKFNGMNGASIAQWTGGTHFIPNPDDADPVFPENVLVPSFHNSKMHAYKNDWVIEGEEDIWYTLPEDLFYGLYAATGIWETVL